MYKTFLISAAFIAASATAFADTAASSPSDTERTASNAQICNPLNFSVYFKTGEAVLTDHARKALEATAESLEGCAIAKVDMTPVSEDGRSESETETLSENRLALVTSALNDQGLLADMVSVRQVEPATYHAPTRTPLARRVDVQLAAYRPDIG